MKFDLICGDVIDGLRQLADESVNCVVTSPPYYGLRDYGVAGQIGLEKSPDAYVARLVEVFVEVRRVLRSDGTCWLNLGDSYNAAGRQGQGSRDGYKQGTNRASATGSDHNRPSASHLKPKDLIGIPWRAAFALQEDGWYLRQDIIWSKANPMPESVRDRCTKAHEYLFLLTKSERYYYDSCAIQEPSITGDQRRPYGSLGSWELDGRPPEMRPNGKLRGKGGRNTFRGQGANREGKTGPVNRDARDMRDIGAGSVRNKRSVWTVATKPYPGSHFAVMPEKLVEPCIIAGCPEGGTCLDPFAGSGTVGVVSLRHNRNFVGIDLNADYIEMARKRISDSLPSLPLFDSIEEETAA